MVKHTFTIGHLYAKQMNVYGDIGNVITLTYRLEKRGFKVVYKPLNSLAELQGTNFDLIVGGGGQDSNQSLIQDDLIKHKDELIHRCEDGLSGLMICGMYQMFGHRFILPNGDEIAGIGYFDMETRASEQRLIGNITVQSDYGLLVGFENHSGRTYLSTDSHALGKVLVGAGNNGTTGEEGIIKGNIIGTYMHGPALAKNPELADELIRRSLLQRGINATLEPLDDEIEHKASHFAARRPK